MDEILSNVKHTFFQKNKVPNTPRVTILYKDC